MAMSCGTGPSTKGAGSGAAPTTSGSPTTAAGGTTSTTAQTETETQIAVWPFATSAIRYRDPAAAAREFAMTYLGFVSPVVGTFRPGDSRSGEVPIRTRPSGPETTVLVRQLGADDSWSVLGASTPNLQLESPAWNTAITSPVTLSGQSTAFEANINIEIRQDGTLTPLASTTAMGGANGEMGPFSTTVTFSPPSSPAGAIILLTRSAEDGSISEASVLRIRFPSLLDAIKSALDSGHLAALAGAMAPTVDYAVAASGAFGTVSGAEAVAKIASYFQQAQPPWDFAISSDTLNIYKPGSYQRYLADDTYFGVTTAKNFISLRVNAMGKIDQVFMAATTDLLK